MKTLEEEFNRFLMESIPNAMNRNKYLKKFEEEGCADIRYMDEFNDDDFLKNDIFMKKLDLKRFKKYIQTFKQKKDKFKQCFKELNKNDIYFEMFENKGILTFDAFEMYIKSSINVKKIIKNIKNSEILFNHIQTKIHYSTSMEGQ